MIKLILRKPYLGAMRKILLCAVVFILPAVSVAGSLVERQDVRTFIDEMVAKHKFDKTALIKLFRQAAIKPKIIEAMNRPAEAKPWYEYRKIFIKSGRIKGGVNFWNENVEALERAEARFGVPAEFIVAIIGVETRFGKYKGTHKVLDSLMTLAFEYPKRSKFFRSELEQYLLLAREEGIDPLLLKGSYAGAMGKPQFISSSYRHYAIDFDDDGKRDLLTNTADAIGSVANYFSKHKWVPGQAVVSQANVKGKKYKALLKEGLKPRTALKRFPEYGVTIPGDVKKSLLGALVELELKSGYEYWVGLQNFYVITRYNRSPLYAMAVYQLSQKIRALRESMMANSNS